MDVLLSQFPNLFTQNLRNPKGSSSAPAIMRQHPPDSADSLSTPHYTTVYSDEVDQAKERYENLLRIGELTADIIGSRHPIQLVRDYSTVMASTISFRAAAYKELVQFAAPGHQDIQEFVGSIFRGKGEHYEILRTLLRTRSQFVKAVATSSRVLPIIPKKIREYYAQKTPQELNAESALARTELVMADSELRKEAFDAIKLMGEVSEWTDLPDFWLMEKLSGSLISPSTVINGQSLFSYILQNPSNEVVSAFINSIEDLNPVAETLPPRLLRNRILELQPEAITKILTSRTVAKDIFRWDEVDERSRLDLALALSRTSEEMITALLSAPRLLPYTGPDDLLECIKRADPGKNMAASRWDMITELAGWKEGEGQRMEDDKDEVPLSEIVNRKKKKKALTRATEKKIRLPTPDYPIEERRKPDPDKIRATLEEIVGYTRAKVKEENLGTEWFEERVAILGGNLVDAPSWFRMEAANLGIASLNLKAILDKGFKRHYELEPPIPYDKPEIYPSYREVERQVIAMGPLLVYAPEWYLRNLRRLFEVE